MASAATESPATDRPKLHPEKGRELIGLLLLTAGILLGASLVSHQPADPSFLHDPAPGARAPVHNWIGAFGAQMSALVFGFLGIAGFALPLGLLVSAARRLRAAGTERVVGRGFGFFLLMLTGPALLALAVGRVEWRAEPILAGGALGQIVSEVLVAGVAEVGAWVILLASVGVALGLTAQSTLGDVLQSWRRRWAERLDTRRLTRARERERLEKEQSRERVVQKHLQRVQEQRDREEGEPPPAPVTLPSGPLRVQERSGEPGFSLRRVKVPAGAKPASGAAEVAAASDAPSIDLDLRGAWNDAPAPVSFHRPAPSAVAGSPAVTPVGSARRAKPEAPRAALAPASAPGRRQEQLSFVGETSAPGLPPVNLLQTEAVQGTFDETELLRLGEAIRTRCTEFGVEGTIEGISPGPVITVFEFQPAPGVKVSQIVNLQDDLALALKAESIRIDRMAGRSTLGIEVPNRQRAIIRLGHLFTQDSFQKAPSPLTMAIGTTISGEPYYADLATMPHLLVAGATGSGKSVGLQSMITSILYKATRDQVQFIFIDPKRIELGVYADIPHMKAEVVVEPKKAANALRWAVAEMERRYRLLAEVHVRSIDVYNRAISDPEVRKRLDLTEGGESTFRPEDFSPLPYYVVVIDELADLMMVAQADVETSIARLAQMARAVGIHLIVATQRPSVDVLTGTIKANFPCRIAFATASRHDSRTILDQVGSEKLLGKGDMLFMPSGSSRVVRLHGAYVSEQETAGLVRWMKKQGKPNLDPLVVQSAANERGSGDAADGDDELFDEAARLVVAERMGSASFLQRRMRIGFSRAARLIDIMEREGILGPSQGSKPREVLVSQHYFAELDEERQD
jgi:DNA segregation ATPase FtsK/SpoIIIE, S-DNA-T family